MPRLSIDDGYTLKRHTSSSFTDGDRVWSNLPVVEFSYRPALPDAIYVWQADTMRTVSGKDQLDATAKLVADHVTAWDVTAGGRVAQINPDTVRKIPYPILQQIVRIVTTWAGPQQEKDAGNSLPVSG